MLAKYLQMFGRFCPERGGIGGYPIKPIILDTEGIFSIISCS